MEETQKKQNGKSKRLGFQIFKIFIITIQIPINMLITYFYGTYIEIMICMLSFVSLRYTFPKTYHCNKLSKCIETTALTFWIANIYMIFIGKNISILINVLVGFIIGYLAYLHQDYIDLKERNKKIKHNRDKIIEILNGDVSLDNIKKYCKSHGIKEDIATTIDDFLNMTIEKVCAKEFLTETAIKNRIRHFIESAN